MTDNWDDSDDEWDVDDAELDARLGIQTPANNFDDEEDLALTEKVANDKAKQSELKKKGTALAEKKKKEQQEREALELAKKAMELESEAIANMSIDERHALERRREEEADNALTDDLFGAVDDSKAKTKAMEAQQAGDRVVMKTLIDHMKHARRVSECFKDHGSILMASSFIKEVLQESKDILDDAAITDIIKTCNVIKNEKVQASKRKVKGQAQKSKKADKVAAVKAKKLHDEVFGDNDNYDEYDEIGATYEDDFF